MSATLFTDVKIFDGSGAEPFPGEVLVRDDRIEAIAKGDTKGAAILPRDGAIIIEGKGRTLMPGMVEAHGHLTWPTSVERVINTMKPLPIEQHTLITAQNARITLDHGFTSVYSAGSLGEKIEPALRDMIDGGFLPGPRLRASALEKGAEGVMGVPAGHEPNHQRDIPHLREYIFEKKAEGCDTIKFLMSSDDAFQPGGAQTLMFTEEEAQAIGNAAREAGIWTACHAQAAEAVKRALRAGFRIIFHCTCADEEALDLFEEKKDQSFTAPAIGLLWARSYEAQDFGIGPAEAEKLGALRGIELSQQVIPQMKKRGIRVLPGGDYGFPYNPHGRNARDLEHFVTLFGFTESEALRAATQHGGELMGMEVGLVKQGWLADLLLVEGDPTKDITIMQDKNNLAAIMKGGVFYKAPA
ncbi:MAG: amidohydrolase family protein [Sphingomonadaceae bacterium]